MLCGYKGFLRQERTIYSDEANISSTALEIVLFYSIDIIVYTLPYVVFDCVLKSPNMGLEPMTLRPSKSDALPKELTGRLKQIMRHMLIIGTPNPVSVVEF